MNVHSSDGRLTDSNNHNAKTNTSRRMILEERDLLSTTNSDVELQYSNSKGGVAFPPSVVTTGIFAGRDAHEKNRYENAADGDAISEKGTRQGREIGSRGGRNHTANGEIGVTTTVEQYYR